METDLTSLDVVAVVAGEGATVTPPAPPEASAAPSSETADAAQAVLDALREALIAADPQVVPELVSGETLTELKASVETARAAFRRIYEQARADLARQVVPHGFASQQPAANFAGLDPLAKIAAGLQGRSADLTR